MNGSFSMGGDLELCRFRGQRALDLCVGQHINQIGWLAVGVFAFGLQRVGCFQLALQLHAGLHGGSTLYAGQRLVVAIRNMQAVDLQLMVAAGVFINTVDVFDNGFGRAIPDHAIDLKRQLDFDGQRQRLQWLAGLFVGVWCAGDFYRFDVHITQLECTRKNQGAELPADLGLLDFNLHGRALPLQPADMAAVFDRACDVFGGKTLLRRQPASHFLQGDRQRIIAANPPQQSAHGQHDHQDEGEEQPAQRAQPAAAFAGRRLRGRCGGRCAL